MGEVMGEIEVKSGLYETLRAKSRTPCPRLCGRSLRLTSLFPTCEQPLNSSRFPNPSAFHHTPIPEIGMKIGTCQNSVQWTGLPFVSGWTRIVCIPRNPESGMPVLPL